MARGVATVATQGSAVEEVVHGAGALFAPGDVAGCALQLERVLHDDALRASMQAAGRDRAAELNWERSAAAHARAYARIAS
jgi:glycosyltransferase involved in cell wall biosynthesis